MERLAKDDDYDHSEAGEGDGYDVSTTNEPVNVESGGSDENHGKTMVSRHKSLLVDWYNDLEQMQNLTDKNVKPSESTPKLLSEFTENLSHHGSKS